MKNYNIKEKLSEYIEFDLDLIINPKNDYAYVFGGAVRDIIANKEINDVDILCLPKSRNNIEKTLFLMDYQNTDLLTPKHLYSMYKDIGCINEPRTWMKGNKIIQLIIPKGSSTRQDDIGSFYKLSQNFKQLLTQVDISCCGVYYSHLGLFESVNFAIKHCEHHICYNMKTSEMHHPNRYTHRKWKLVQRGWEFVEDMNKEKLEKLEKQIHRSQKFNILLETI